MRLGSYVSSLIALSLLLALPQPAVPGPAAIGSALRSHQYARARDLAETALKTSPHDPKLWTLSALALEGLGDPGKALEAYRRALVNAPNYLPALKGKAGIEYKTAQPEAEQTLHKILEQQPDDQVSHAMLGAIAFKQGDCAGARSQYGASLQAIASEPQALTEFGQCLLEDRQNREAITVLRQAAQQKPADWTGGYNVALAELLTNAAPGALADLHPLLAAGKPPAKALDLASAAYEAQGDTPNAVATLRQAIVQYPADAQLYLHFVDLCFVHRSFQAGIDMVTAGLTPLPASAQLYAARGILWAQLGKYAEADADFRKADQLDPAQSFSSLAQGVSDLQSANFDQAIAKAESQIRKNPNDAFPYYLKAEALNSKGLEANTPALRSAIDAATHAVRLRPDFPLAENLLGSFYRKQGSTKLAREQFENVLRQDPENQSALYQLVLLERGAGRGDRVRSLLKRLGEAKQKARQDAVTASRYQLITGPGN